MFCMGVQSNYVILIYNTLSLIDIYMNDIFVINF